MANFAVPSDDVSVNTEDEWVSLSHPDFESQMLLEAGAIVASNLNGDRSAAADTLSKFAVKRGWADDPDEVSPDFRVDQSGKRLVVSSSIVNDMSVSEVEDMLDDL
jgi:hypothetical protein